MGGRRTVYKRRERVVYIDSEHLPVRLAALYVSSMILLPYQSAHHTRAWDHMHGTVGRTVIQRR